MENKLNYGSAEIIGNVKERFDELIHKGWKWRSFYNGWIEGRAEMLDELKIVKKMEYKVLFEFYGRKMKTAIDASSSLNAMDKIRDKIIFHKVEEEKHIKQEDKTLDDLLNMFGMKK